MNHSIVKGLLLTCLAITPAAQAKVEHLLPRPQSVTVNSGSLPLTGSFTLTDPTASELLSEFFTDNGCTLGPDGTPVTVTLTESIDGAYDYALDGFPCEAYTLTVTPAGIDITAVTATGVIRAAQTLTQLAEGHEGTPGLECVSITDWPAFKLRGFMHDVGRSYITTDEIINEIELLSRFKVNTFHWHMTENQAWRFEVKAYPELTSAASMTRYAGSYYSQDDCRRVAEAAAKHGIIIIPEIDMPGHSAAFKRATGLDMQTAQGKAILLKVLEEAAGVFVNSPYIHIGGDEVAITDNTFLDTMIDKLHSLGKKVVCWNKINGVNIADHAFDMTQMWATAGTKVAGIPNIDCRYNYTNHFDVFADLVGIYKSSIYYVERGNAEVAGTISCPWNDRKTPSQEDIIRQNNVYANTLASAERAWIGGGKQYIEKGGTTLPNSGEEYEEFADWERRFLFHKAHSLRNEPIPYVKQTNVRWRITDAFPNGGSATASFPPEEELADSYTWQGAAYGTGTATGAGIYLRHTWGGTIPTFFASPALNTTAYAYTYVYSPEDRAAGALIEFQNYGRSENDYAPEAGKWDRKGSRVWLNDEEILPPVWANSGKAISAEVDLQNENFSARAPQPVQLKQGWNKVLIKLPYVTAPNVRLNKWLFTFVITDTEGRNALDDLIYSPSQCMDQDSEALSALISEIKSFLRANVRDEVGYYAVTPESAALLKLAEDAEATLVMPGVPGEVRQSQCQALQTSFNVFKNGLANGAIVLPTDGHMYTMHTPQRDNRYLTHTSAGLTGQAAATEASQWIFDARADGTYDIRNFSTNAYINHTAANNTQLTTSTSVPAKGWTVSKSSVIGLVIVTNGTTQFNQTNSGLGYKIYNWGSGTNTTDTGCMYAFTEIPGEDDGITLPTANDTAAPAVTAVRGSVSISGYTGAYTLYNMQGRVLASGHCPGAATVAAPQGMTVLSLGARAYKLAIR